MRIGTRGSALALAQAALVRAALIGTESGVECETVVIATTGDGATGVPGTGVFVREIQQALLQDRIDVAVHSLKDLPVDPVEKLTLGAFLPRQDAHDAFVTRDGSGLAELPRGARVGTGSPRRQVQLKRRFPSLEFTDIRGNVDTRIRKAKEGEVDAVVLAYAGLKRLGLESAASGILSFEECLPAPGQGAMVCEARTSDEGMIGMLGRINDPATATAVRAERRYLKGLGGGCRSAIAAYAECKGASLTIRGFVAEAHGGKFLEASLTQDGGGEELGEKLAERMLASGAADLLAA